MFGSVARVTYDKDLTLGGSLTDKLDASLRSEWEAADAADLPPCAPMERRDVPVRV